MMIQTNNSNIYINIQEQIRVREKKKENPHKQDLKTMHL